MLSKNWIYLISALMLISCDRGSKKADVKVDFGQSIYYKPFLGVETTHNYLERIFVLDFSKDCFLDPGTFVDLDFIEKKSGESLINRQDIIVAFNGEEVNETPARIFAHDFKDNNELTIGIKFTDDTKEAVYNGQIMILRTDLDRVNEYEVIQGVVNDPLFLWRAKFTTTWNPLFRKIFWFLVVVLSILVIWFVLLQRIFFPRFEGGELHFSGELEYPVVKLKKYKAFYIGNVSMKQSALGKLFAGKNCYLKVHSPDIRFRMVIKPVPFSKHKDRRLKRRRLAAFQKLKSSNFNLKKIEPESITLYGKEVLYNNAKYCIHDSITITYLNIKHSKI